MAFQQITLDTEVNFHGLYLTQLLAPQIPFYSNLDNWTTNHAEVYKKVQTNQAQRMKECRNERETSILGQTEDPDTLKSRFPVVLVHYF